MEWNCLVVTSAYWPLGELGSVPQTHMVTQPPVTPVPGYSKPSLANASTRHICVTHTYMCADNISTRVNIKSFFKNDILPKYSGGRISILIPKEGNGDATTKKVQSKAKSHVQNLGLWWNDLGFRTPLWALLAVRRNSIVSVQLYSVPVAILCGFPMLLALPASYGVDCNLR